MHIKEKSLLQFTGGQFRTWTEKETFQGEIKTVYILNDILYVNYKWLAKKDNTGWHYDTNLTYTVSLGVFNKELEFEESHCLYSTILGELLILFRPTSMLLLEKSKIK